MEKTLEQTQMEEGTAFAKEHIVELAKLIVDWQDTGLLGNGSHCLVHDLANMLPGRTGSINITLAETIIKDICLKMIGSSRDKTNQNKTTQEEFNVAFNKILEGSTKRYLNAKTRDVSKEKTSRIEVLDSNGNWLLEYDYNPKNSCFYYQYMRVYWVLCEQFSLQDDEIQAFMKNLVESQYNLKGVTTYVLGAAGATTYATVGV